MAEARLDVWRDGKAIGLLERVDESSPEYFFSYTELADRAISLSLPLRQEPFAPIESRPFFEALLPEGAIREQITRQFKLSPADSFGLLRRLGEDSAGALQISEPNSVRPQPSAEWLDAGQLDRLILDLPKHPLGLESTRTRMRLSLAGVQNKAVLIRDAEGRYGRPLDGMPSTHILKPEPAGGNYPGLATNEYFCMLLASRCGLDSAGVELTTIAGMPCLVVSRYDREPNEWPPVRLHQEDLCQALGLLPAFKYQEPERKLPSYRALAQILDQHAGTPGRERLAAALASVFNFIVGNSDAHAKNISLLHLDEGVRLAPLYDIVSTVAYPDLDDQLAISIGDEFDPASIFSIHLDDLGTDFGLNTSQFRVARQHLASAMLDSAKVLHQEAVAAAWHHPCLDAIIETIQARSLQAGLGD